MTTLIPTDHIENKIYVIRGQRVMLDADLAKLYGLPTNSITRAVKRNPLRFPADFAFILTADELKILIRQIGVSRLHLKSSGWGGRRFMPYVFSEHGVLMLSSVLRSEQAALINVSIMRAFVKLREMVSAHRDLSKKLEDMEKKLTRHEGRIRIHTSHIKQVFNAIWELMNSPKRQIGFSK